MAKGQKKSNREAKKPKQVKSKTPAGDSPFTTQLTAAKAKKS